MLTRVPEVFTLADLARLVDDGKTPDQPSRLNRALAALAEAGKVTKTHPGGPGDPTKWKKA